MSQPYESSPHFRITTMATSYFVTQAVLVAAELGIADVLALAPLTAEEVAAKLSLHARSSYRLMRALVAMGVLSEDASGRFSLTPVGELLRSDTNESMRDFVRMMRDNYKAWGELLSCVRSGESGFPRVFGKPLFEYLRDNPERGAIFDGAMSGVSRMIGKAAAGAYDWNRFATIVDLGGGDGTLVAELLAAHPRPRGVLADLPEVVERGRQHLAARSLTERVAIAPTDFFQSVPDGADAYVLKSVLHDWDDDRAVAILRNIRRASAGTATVLLIERVLAPAGHPDPSALSDLHMLAVVTGCERTEAEWRRLLTAGGFSLDRLIPIPTTLRYIIEAHPIA